MSVDAVCLGCVLGCEGVGASEDVDSANDWFEVGGVDASLVLAEVVDGVSVWNWPDEVFVGDSVCAALSVLTLEAPIACAVVAAEPFPAILRPPHTRQKPALPIHSTSSSSV